MRKIIDTTAQATYIGAFFLRKEHDMRSLAAVTLLLLSLQMAVAQSKSASNLQVHQDEGGSVAVRIPGGFLNQDSSLKRTFYVINDPSAPAAVEHAGVFPRLDEKDKGDFLLPFGTVSPKEAISAVELRYVLFDVWGERIRTLSSTRLVDSSTHVEFRGSNKWLALESEVGQLVTVVSFVARVRTAEGGVWTFDPNRMASRLEELGLNAAPLDLMSDEQRMINPGLIYWTYSAKNGESVRATGVLRP
jgi:hypothetical protein